MRKKAQVEIIGIAIVLVVIIIGALFLFGLNTKSQKSQPVSISEEIRIKNLGSNFLNAMLKTTTDCEGYSVQDLFKDCFTDKLIKCGSMSSCDKVKDLSKNSFFKFFDDIEEYYNFKVYFNGDEQKDLSLTSKNKLKCRKTYDFTAVFQTFNLDEIKLKLTLCAE
ncbi:MAG: hypothetical protein ACP5H9_05035 [Candidatus Woesearchaeota archaeon]